MKKSLPFIMLLLRLFLFAAGGLLLSLITNNTLEQASRWWSSLCVVINIITILILLLVCKYEKIKFADLIRGNKAKASIKEILLIILAMIILGIGGMYGFGFLIYGHVPVTMIQPIPIWLAIVNFVLLPVSVVFAEMPLYFGYCLPKIESITKSKHIAFVCPILFYALQHSFIPLIFDWKHILFRFLSFLPLMCVLGIWYYKKRKLIPLMIGHIILDFATGFQILLVSIFPIMFEMMS